MNTPLITVIYDSITNSVFESQVLQPLINEKIKDPQRPVYLISFETQTGPFVLSLSKDKRPVHASTGSARTGYYQYLYEQLSIHNIHYIQYKKIPYIGFISLRIAAYKLKKFLTQLDQYELLARGPFAGFICLHALDKKKCTHITIQARGLLAEEYAHTHKNNTNIFMRPLHAWKKRSFYLLERYVYGVAPHTYSSLSIQTVSTALSDYLIATYNTSYNCIYIATHDIPSPISLEQRTIWRATMRTQMNINSNAHVYCYNGSIKPWQYPDGVMQLFKEKYRDDTSAILVILTHDNVAFEKLLQTHQIPSHAYRIYTMPHAQIYAYLAACDIGILLREPNIINWTSRPTKLLEYQAVGLEIEHNNTVAYAIQKDNL